MPLEGGERAAPDESGGALLEIRRSQLVATEELTTEQFCGLVAEETWLELGAKLGLCALSVVLGALAS